MAVYVKTVSTLSKTDSGTLLGEVAVALKLFWLILITELVIVILGIINELLVYVPN